jgi:hypothetical protein
MPTTEVTAPLGHTTSETINFRNPFDEVLQLSVEMQQVSLLCDCYVIAMWLLCGCYVIAM